MKRFRHFLKDYEYPDPGDPPKKDKEEDNPIWDRIRKSAQHKKKVEKRKEE